MNEFKQLKQNQRVEFTIDDVLQEGKIVGKSTTDQPMIGGIYIIEPDVSISSDVYEYSHFVLPQCMLTLLDER